MTEKPLDTLIPLSLQSPFKTGTYQKGDLGISLRLANLTYHKATTPSNNSALLSWFYSIKYLGSACRNQNNSNNTPLWHPQKDLQASENHVLPFLLSLLFLGLCLSSHPVRLGFCSLECLERGKGLNLFVSCFVCCDSFNYTLGLNLCFTIHELWEAGKITCFVQCSWNNFLQSLAQQTTWTNIKQPMLPACHRTLINDGAF